MKYKCGHCQTAKAIFNSALTITAYCETCRCTRLFLSDRTPTSPRSGTPTSSSFVAIARLGDERRSSSSLVHSSSASAVHSCDYFKLCLEFMLSLDYAKRLFNRKQNRCYCRNCYSASSKDFLIEGGSKYVIPRGWVRFGLYVDDAQAEAEQIWSRWIVSYHGTTPEAAKSIIEHHQFLLPGDRCMGGHVIGIRDGHIPDKFQVYTSPTIAYSGDDIYSPSTPFRSRTTRKSYQAKVVLQCRQKPRTYITQPETIGATDEDRRICPIIPNSQVEYFTEVRSSIIPYGLLIRVFE